MKVFCHCFVIKYLYVYIFLLRFPETVCQRTVNMFLFRCCGITWSCIRIQDSLCIFCGMLRVSFVSCGGLSCLPFFSVYFCYLIVFLDQFSFSFGMSWKKFSGWFMQDMWLIFLMTPLFVLQVKIALFCLRVSVKFGVTVLSLWHVSGGMLVV